MKLNKIDTCATSEDPVYYFLTFFRKKNLSPGAGVFSDNNIDLHTTVGYVQSLMLKLYAGNCNIV